MLEKNVNNVPRIYVACLDAYNNGIHHGNWIELNEYTDENVIQEEIDLIIKSSPGYSPEEWAIHAYEGFYELSIGEHESFEKLIVYSKIIREHGEVGSIFINLANDYGMTLDDSDNFNDCYYGHYDNAKDFVLKSEVLECYNFSQMEKDYPNLARYFDYDAFARDLELSGDYIFEKSKESFGVYVFQVH